MEYVKVGCLLVIIINYLNINEMRILFLFPGPGIKPVGGYKVVYEYANRLAADGYDVGVVYAAYCVRLRQNFLIAILRMCKALIRFFNLKYKNRFSCRNWFPLDKRVKEHWVFSLSEWNVPKSDVYVATAIKTSLYLNSYKRIDNINKYYLIQHFEDWGEVTERDVLKTYHFPINKIVIAHWLEEIVRAQGEECVFIPNGFDFKYFQMKTPLKQRNKMNVCMLYHRSEWKGCSDAFAALALVKEKYPSLQVNIFGVFPRPDDLPEWYHYYQKPDKVTHNWLYNESAIFVGPSWTEGWGLTVGEAMICGCAVACTDNAGYLEMATDGETALVSPVRDPESLAHNIIRLIEDDELRFRIAEAGCRNIRQFTWEKAYLKFKETLENIPK